jgi:hypothetical protein
MAAKLEKTVARRMFRAAALLLAGVGAYHLGVRPRLLRWGAETDEIERTLPGDGRIADPYVVSTRALSVAAQPHDVWPWLVQMGDGRGGLYSYDRLDMLFGYIHAPSANVVLLEYQDLAVGDVIPIGTGPDWAVTVVDPEHALVIEPAGGQVTWCWTIAPIDDLHTRLVSRVRLRVGPRLLLWVLAPAIDLPWFAMKRQMLRGIARRAEALMASRRAEAGGSAPNRTGAPVHF